MSGELVKRVSLGLSFGSDLTAPAWDPRSPGTEVWLDNSGAECAYGRYVDGYHWMHVKGIGDFRIEPGAAATVKPVPWAARNDVVDSYYRTLLPIALQLEGFESLHGSAVIMPQGVVALCAVSGTGKSTIAFGLEKCGHQTFADDALVFAVDDSHVRLFSVPFAMRLRAESACYFQARSRDEVRISGGEITEYDRPLAGICLLERFVPEGPALSPVAISRLPANEAFSAVLPHAYCFRLSDSERKAAMMRSYLELVRRIPVLRVRFCPGFEHLPTILAAIERAAEELVPAEAGPAR